MISDKQTADFPACVILCGGRGERLRPLTEEIPKPLVLLEDRPILSYLMDHLRKFPVGKVVAAAGFQAEKIRLFFQKNFQDMAVEVVDSGKADILQRILSCANHLAGDFMVLYGDTLADVDLSALQSFHRSHRAQASMCVWPLQSPFGVVDLDAQGVVTRFREKPQLDSWINIGNFYFDHGSLEKMALHRTFVEFLENLAMEGQIRAFPHRGSHITINTLLELEQARNEIHLFGGRR